MWKTPMSKERIKWVIFSLGHKRKDLWSVGGDTWSRLEAGRGNL